MLPRPGPLRHHLLAGCILLLCAVGCRACVDPAPPRLSPAWAEGPVLPPIDRAKVLFIGHSLVAFDMPAMLVAAARSIGLECEVAVQAMDGGCLQENWKERERAQGIDARTALRTGAYDVVVMTEAVDLDDMIYWMEPVKYGGYFYDAAIRANPDTRVFLYETWHDRDLVRRHWYGLEHGDWRAYLDDDLGKWEGIVAGIRDARDGAPMRLVPAGQAMARLHDEARAGRVPGLPDESSLFSDVIHLSPTGCYFVALVHLATIFRRSPEGATNEAIGKDGTVLTTIDPETARAMQRIAWDVVRRYAWSGLTAP